MMLPMFTRMPLALGLAERTVVEEREPDAPSEVEHAGETGHAVERAGLAAEVAGERRPDELVEQRAVLPGDRQAVVERRRARDGRRG